jgi:hypothetical protein
VVIGAKGVERIVEIKLDREEKALFNNSVKAVKGLMTTITKMEQKAAKAKAPAKRKVTAKKAAAKKAPAKKAVTQATPAAK